MKQLVLRIGSALYPLVTAFALTAAPACTSSSSAPSGDDDSVDPAGDDSGEQPMPAAPGDLDKSFGTNGIKMLAPTNATATALAMQGNKVLVCYTEASPSGSVGHVARFTADGSLDPSFATGGIFTYTQSMIPSHSCSDVTVQRDGLIIMSLHYANTNYALPLTPEGSFVALPDMAMGYSTRLAAYHTQDGVVGAGFSGSQVAFASQTNTAVTNSNVPANISAVGALVVSPADWPVIVANAKDPSSTETWQVLLPAGGSMTNFGTTPTLGTPVADLIHGAMWMPDSSILAFGSVDNDREVMAVHFPVNGDAPTVEHHISAAGGVAQARAAAIDAAGGTILVGTAGPVGKPMFSWQRYAPNSVTLDDTYQQAGIATVASPSDTPELVDVAEANGALYAVGTIDTETATPHMVLLKITE